MEKLRLPDKIIPYIEALRQLIRTGAMASPTLETSCLVDLPAVWQRVMPGASRASRAHVFIKVLHQVIRQRLEGKDTQTGIILFGFEEYAGVPIQDRYRAVAKLYSPYWTWENYRKEPLTRHLLAVYLSLEREAELAPVEPHFGEAPAAAQNGRIGQDWRMESYESIYNFPTRPGQPLEVVQKRRLRATATEVSLWRHRTFWRERGVSALPEVTLFGPGVISVTDTHVDTRNNLRIFITELQLPQPLRYGEALEFTLIKRLPVTYNELIRDSGKDWFGLHNLASQAEHIRVGLRFPDKRPSMVWHHRNMISGLLRPGVATATTRLSIDSTGFVSHIWSNVPAGLSYGISLGW